MATYKMNIDTASQSIVYTVAERPIYPSTHFGCAQWPPLRAGFRDRVGIYAYSDTVYPLPPAASTSFQPLHRGYRQYELKNHLGNVMTVVSGHKTAVANTAGDSISHFLAQILHTADYSPFGVQLPERTFDGEGYRYGWGGHEKTDELKGSGNHYTAEFWEYDPRTARRWNVDPVYKHHLSNYSVMSGNPILRIDPNGANDTDYVFDKNSGKLSVVEGTQDDGPDRIIVGKAKYKDGELKNSGGRVLQLEGKIENLKDGSMTDNIGEFNYQTYTFSNAKDGDDAYSFMAFRTNIEISKMMLQSGNGGSQTRFFTSGSTEEIRGETLFLEHNLLGKDPNAKLISHTHNHGNPAGGRLGSYNPSPDDLGLARGLTNLFNHQKTKPKFYVWRFGTTTEYDQIGPVK